MTTPMLEKLARAIYEGVPLFRVTDSCVMSLHPGVWEAVDTKTRTVCLAQARAVLIALREPDEGMMEKGFKQRARGAGLADIWQAMIDHILEGETK